MFQRTFWLLFFFPLLASAMAPSGETWFTLSTPNFRVHHTAKLEKYARKIASSLERALPLIENKLEWQPKSPIDIVVMDPSDSANGFAANFPNTHIEVFAVPFEPDSALSQYVDWVDELATHELTHIVANDGSRGGYKFLRSIFGSWVKPNGLQPVWLIEGLAVFQETSLTPGGRGRSPMLEAILREASLNNRINNPDYISLDRLNDGVPWWPAGSTAYLIGYSIQAAANFGHKDIPGKLSFENANRLPYMPNTNLEDIIGKDWYAIWDETELRLKSRYGLALSNELGRCQLTHSGQFTGGQRISADGWVYFSEEDWNYGYHLARFRLNDNCEAKIERLDERESQSPASVAISTDGKKIAYTKTERAGREKIFNDLYIWDNEKKKSTQITVNQRASEPAFYGNDLIYVENNGGNLQSIQRKNLSTGETTTIFTAKPFERITGLNTGKIHNEEKILFSLHNNQGKEEIVTLHSSEAMALMPQEKNSHYQKNPSVTPDGQILFASYENARTQDIYSYDFTSRKKTLIYRSPYGFADRPTLSADGKKLLVQEYTSNGLNLVSLPWEKNKKAENLSPLPQEDLHEFLSGEKIKDDFSDLSENFASSVPYNAAKTPATSMWPQYWLPQINAMDYGALIGASTGGNDPLNYHTYSALVQYDTRAKFPTYNFTYINRYYPTYFLFTAQQSNSYFLSTKTSNRVNFYSVEASIPIQEATYTLGAAYQQKNLFGARGTSTFHFQNLSYENVGKRPSAIDFNSGAYLNLYAGFYPEARNEKSFLDIRPRASYFFRGFHPSHSVSLSVLAGISTNNQLATNYYLGGGPSYLTPSNFVVHGYPVDALLGQRIATANFSYTLPIAHPYRGWHMNPLFLSTLGLRLMGDIGSANYLATYRDQIFRGYRFQKLGQKNLVGTGIDFIANGSMLYHIPISLSLGFHYGVQKDYGGEPMLYLGANLGSLIETDLKSIHH